MTKEAALYEFWAGFGLPAYEENSVPEKANYPYITYEIMTDSFGEETYLTASLWYYSTVWSEANAKKREIAEFIGMGGVTAPIDGGAVWIKRGSPFAQNMGESSDDMIKRIVFNIAVEYWTQN